MVEGTFCKLYQAQGSLNYSKLWRTLKSCDTISTHREYDTISTHREYDTISTHREYDTIPTHREYDTISTCREYDIISTCSHDVCAYVHYQININDSF